MVRLKRVYEPASPEDGYRILIDRLWPRGVSKVRARVDWWAREIAPSTELRKWFGHNRSRWPGFQQRYKTELDAQPQAIQKIREKAAQGTVTILFAAKDAEHSNAACLRNYLEEQRS